MITEFHIFEYNTNPDKKDIKKNTYVILNIHDLDIPHYVRNYINSDVGIFTNVSWGEEVVEYYNVSDEVCNWIRNHENFDMSVDGNTLYVKRVQSQEIVYISDNKEELEMILQSDKFNL